jgi:hypothetical protein
VEQSGNWRWGGDPQRAIQMFGREEFHPIIDGITIGLPVLLVFIGSLMLGIGGVGVMNIMLVSVDERVREIGLQHTLGARRPPALRRASLKQRLRAPLLSDGS